MIVCDKRCEYQKEGYCTLEDISTLSGLLRESCGYYYPVGEARPQDAGVHESVT